MNLRPRLSVQPDRSSIGADDGTRTRNRRFTKPLLYQLSYVGRRTDTHRRVHRAKGDDTALALRGSSAVLRRSTRTSVATPSAIEITSSPRRAADGARTPDLVGLVHAVTSWRSRASQPGASVAAANTTTSTIR